MNTKSIFSNIFIFSIFSGLYLFSTSNEKNDIETFPVIYNAYGVNQYGLDRQSMDFIDKGYFKNLDRKELDNLYQDKENFHKLKLIANAYQFYDTYLLGFIRTKQECEFEGNNINCQIYLNDKDFNDLKYKASIKCTTENNCNLIKFSSIITEDFKNNYVCNENFVLDYESHMCIHVADYTKKSINAIMNKITN